MSIYFVRHGQDEDNAAGLLNGRRDDDLTDYGRQKALETARKLKEQGIKTIYSSPLKRAQQTAHIIAGELRVNRIMIEPHLTERDFGVATGYPVAEMAKFASQTLSDNKFTYPLDTPQAETFPKAYQRAAALLEKIKQQYPEQNVLLVSHGEFGKMLRAAAQGISWQDGVKSPYIENGEIIKLL